VQYTLECSRRASGGAYHSNSSSYGHNNSSGNSNSSSSGYANEEVDADVLLRRLRRVNEESTVICGLARCEGNLAVTLQLRPVPLSEQQQQQQQTSSSSSSSSSAGSLLAGFTSIPKSVFRTMDTAAVRIDTATNNDSNNSGYNNNTAAGYTDSESGGPLMDNMRPFEPSSSLASTASLSTSSYDYSHSSTTTATGAATSADTNFNSSAAAAEECAYIQPVVRFLTADGRTHVTRVWTVQLHTTEEVSEYLQGLDEEAWAVVVGRGIVAGYHDNCVTKYGGAWAPAAAVGRPLQYGGNAAAVSGRKGVSSGHTATEDITGSR
jgi:hypothetical protein